MDGSRFDALSRVLADVRSRRSLPRLLSGLLLGGSLAFPDLLPTAAKSKKRRKKHKPRPPVPVSCATGEKPCDGRCIPAS